jgi:hypothetical protein
MTALRSILSTLRVCSPWQVYFLDLLAWMHYRNGDHSVQHCTGVHCIPSILPEARPTSPAMTPVKDDISHASHNHTLACVQGAEWLPAALTACLGTWGHTAEYCPEQLAFDQGDRLIRRTQPFWLCRGTYSLPLQMLPSWPCFQVVTCLTLP